MSARPTDEFTAERRNVRPLGAPETAQRLRILDDLFAQLDAAAIRYCHWKSNEHLGPALTGLTDVDVLFERRSAQRLAHVLTGSTSFKRFIVKAGRGYPGIEDYVGFDAATGMLTHLHVHYQLTLGEKFLKGHRLPWEEVVLATRVRDPEHGVWVTDPHLELLILIARAAIKLRWRDRLLSLLGYDYVRGSMLREMRWLAARVDASRLRDVATPLVGAAAADTLEVMIAGARPSIGQLRAFHRRTRPRLQEYRMYTAAGTVRRMLIREWTWIWWRLKHTLLGASTMSTRTPPQGGLAVAFVGADGAGKSTLASSCADWLSREIAVALVYGGSGVGTVFWPRRWLQRLGKLGRRRPAPRAPAGEPASRHEPTGFRKLGRALWVLALARERRRWARHLRRARSLGLVVLSDRLPQSQFAGLNDGPHLGSWLTAESWWQRLVARREQAAFRQAELLPPDVVIRLRVPTEIAARRKPDTPRDHLERKVAIVAQLAFPLTTRVFEVDAAQPLEQVRLEAKRAIWECL